MKLSIVIPVINEADNIQQTLESLQFLRKSGHEIILVDGGSSDATCFVARPLVDKLLCSEPGRARQMNTGTVMAQGNILIFLHADTILPSNVEEIIACIPGQTFWGRFDVKLSGSKAIFRIIEKLINLRSRMTGIATGDQAIFMTKNIYKTVNGFPEIPLMEDVAICEKLKSIKPPVCLTDKVLTSSRRWESRGTIKTILLMWKLRMQYALGVSPEVLARKYE